MRTHGPLQKYLALVVLITMVVGTTPISAAELVSKAPPLGSVFTVGSVELRGIGLTQEGTLFSGDKIHVGSGASARILMVSGQKFVLSEKTDLTASRVGQTVGLQLRSGNVAFNASKSSPIEITLGDYRITSTDAVGGNVALVGDDYIGVRVVTGRVQIKNTRTSASYVVSAGQERLLGVKVPGIQTPFAQLASTVPSAVPQAAGAPQAQGITKSGWAAIAATIGGAALVIGLLATRGDDDDDTATILARQRATQQATSVSASGAQASTSANLVASTAGTTAAVAALPAAARTQAQSIQSAATATQQQIAALNTQLNSLQAQLPGATSVSAINSIAAQIETVRVSLNGSIGTLNAQIAQLNTLLQQNANVPGVPTTVIPTVPVAPAPASASIPG